MYEAVINVQTEDERVRADILVVCLFATPIVSNPVLSI